MNLPKRVSKQPIFISIASPDPTVNKLSGQYNFHSLNNNTAVFVRDGPTIEAIGSYSYYLAYQKKHWNLQHADFFEKGQSGGCLALSTKGFGLKCSYNKYVH